MPSSMSRPQRVYRYWRKQGYAPEDAREMVLLYLDHLRQHA